MANGSNSAENLSISRINRLLRPLRNRCAALATFDRARSTRPSLCITYSNSRSLIYSEAPPLANLPNPGSCVSRSQIEKYSDETLELARKIYAVVAAFKDILEKTQSVRGRSYNGPQNDRTELGRIPSLRRMCSMIIGQHMEPDLEPDSTKLEEEEAIDIVGSLYEEIPPMYRGWTLTSHALQIILDICPHSPTLLKVLLDTALENNLFQQSRTLLKALLVVAFSAPAPSRIPPICHPAHSNFLIELLALWERRDQVVSAFLGVFNDVMDQIASTDAWSCKATTKLLYHDCRRSPLVITPVSCGLIRFIFQSDLYDPSDIWIRPNFSSQISRAANLRRTLRVWLECVLNSFISSPPAAEPEHDLDTVWTLLETCMEHGVHLCRSSRDAPDQDAGSVVICIATLLLSQKLLRSQIAILFSLLCKVEPFPSTYEPLISQTIAIATQVEVCSKRIQCYAGALRSHGLLRLEASLWVSSLREVEKSEYLLDGCDKDALRKYRATLIECVEDAEQRCFGSSSTSWTDISPRCRGWEWEPVFGCWTRKNSPVGPTRVASNCSSVGAAGSSTESPLRKKPRLSRRPSSFASLLSNALSNRTILHGSFDLSSSYRECEYEGPVETLSEQWDKGRIDMDNAVFDHDDISDLCHPSSEDGLNLFAYSTSPARP